MTHHEFNFPLPTIQKLVGQGLTLWQAGEFLRLMQRARSEKEDGRFTEADRLEAIAINAGNLKDFEILR